MQPGQPLYTIANLDTLRLRADVSGAQLAGLRIGQPVRVQIDVANNELTSLPGRITWVAPEAEFTPTPIQTRDERTEQVYDALLARDVSAIVHFAHGFERELVRSNTSS